MPTPKIDNKLLDNLIVESEIIGLVKQINILQHIDFF